jgi:hypothetical protein
MGEYRELYSNHELMPRYYDCEELPPNIGVLFAIFRRVWQPKGRPTNTPEKYMRECADVVRPIGRAFVWLGLAVPDDNSPFGFSATSRLMGALVGQTNHRGRRVHTEPSADDDKVFSSIREVADPDEGCFGFVKDALVAAGLAIKKKDDDNVYIPTMVLRKMVHDRLMVDLALEFGIEICM